MRIANRCGKRSGLCYRDRKLVLDRQVHDYFLRFGSGKSQSSSSLLLLVLKALKACSTSRDLDAGAEIFSRDGVFFSSDLFVATAAVDMFAKCGNLEEAQSIFDSMAFHDVVSWNALMQGYVMHGREDAALNLFTRIQASRETISPDARTFIAALMACSQMAAKEQGNGSGAGGSTPKSSWLKVGKSIHLELEKAGFESEVFVASVLVDMYSSCGSMVDARKVFEWITPDRRDVVLWTGLIMGYISNGQPDEALELFELMRSGSSPCQPNARTFIAGIAACTALASKEAAKLVEGMLVKVESLRKGSRFHVEAVKRGFGSDLFLANCAMDMYAKCGAMTRAREVFDGMVRRTAVSWTTLMMGYVENGQPEQALEIFQLMRKQKTELPTSRSYVAALLACSSLALKEEGRKIAGAITVKIRSLDIGISLRAEALAQGFGSDVFVTNASIDMFAKCGSMEIAHAVFRDMKRPDVVSWTSLIQGYTANGESMLALETLSEMEESGACKPNAWTYVAGIVACGNLNAENRSHSGFFLEKGREIHSKVVTRGYISDVFVVNSLITMYSKCCSPFEARQVFENYAASVGGKPDVVSWNSLLSSYIDNGEAEMASELFSRIDSPDSRTFVIALSACAAMALKETPAEVEEGGKKLLKLKTLEKVMALHSLATEHGFSSDTFVANRLIDVYAKCCSMLDARKVFDTMVRVTQVSWTSLISGYVDNELPEVALELFEKMDSDGNCKPDSRTFTAALSAVLALAPTEAAETTDAKAVSLERGRALHSRAQSCGVDLEEDGFAANALITFYSKCGSTIDARNVFEAIRQPGVASWTCLMLGYSDNGQAEMALETFARMRTRRVEPDIVSMAAVLVACAEVVDRETGKHIHGQIYRQGEETSSSIVANALMDFFSKCGMMQSTQWIFDSIADGKDVIAWNCLIAGFGRLGDPTMALESFERMIREGIKPSPITFVSVLTTCSHCGLIEQGKKWFESMVPIFGVHPTVQHYTCMVDMLARADNVEDAIATMEKMPYRANEVTWTAVMGAKSRLA